MLVRAKHFSSLVWRIVSGEEKKSFTRFDTWILVDDVHQDAVDVAPKLGVDLLLVLQRCPELPQK
jgi:hypothetical protein